MPCVRRDGRPAVAGETTDNTPGAAGQVAVHDAPCGLTLGSSAVPRSGDLLAGCGSPRLTLRLTARAAVIGVRIPRGAPGAAIPICPGAPGTSRGPRRWRCRSLSRRRRSGRPAAAPAASAHVPAGSSWTPHPDAVGVDLRTGLGPGDGMAVVAHLAPGSISWRGWPSLAPKLRWSNTSAPSPPAAKASAKLSRYISLTAEKPWAMTTVGTGPLAPSGRYSQPRRVTP